MLDLAIEVFFGTANLELLQSLLKSSFDKKRQIKLVPGSFLCLERAIYGKLSNPDVNLSTLNSIVDEWEQSKQYTKELVEYLNTGKKSVVKQPNVLLTGNDEPYTVIQTNNYHNLIAVDTPIWYQVQKYKHNCLLPYFKNLFGATSDLTDYLLLSIWRPFLFTNYSWIKELNLGI